LRAISFFVFRALFFLSRKAAKTQRGFSLRLFAFVRYPFISLRLCAYAAWPAALRVRSGGFFFSQSRQDAKRFFFALSHLCEVTLYFFASLRLCAITPFLKNSLTGYLQSELFHFLSTLH
jgi:hypothetical protein